MNSKRFMEGKFSPAEIWQIRKEIRAGSLFYADYENSFGIDRRIVSDVSDFLIELAQEKADENHTDFDTEFALMDNPDDWHCAYSDVVFAYSEM